jgi:hypothetical protein
MERSRRSPSSRRPRPRDDRVTPAISLHPRATTRRRCRLACWYLVSGRGRGAFVDGYWYRSGRQEETAESGKHAGNTSLGDLRALRGSIFSSGRQENPPRAESTQRTRRPAISARSAVPSSRRDDKKTPPRGESTQRTRRSAISALRGSIFSSGRQEDTAANGEHAENTSLGDLRALRGSVFVIARRSPARAPTRTSGASGRSA